MNKTTSEFDEEQAHKQACYEKTKLSNDTNIKLDSRQFTKHDIAELVKLIRFVRSNNSDNYELNQEEFDKFRVYSENRKLCDKHNKKELKSIAKEHDIKTSNKTKKEIAQEIAKETTTTKDISKTTHKTAHAFRRILAFNQAYSKEISDNDNKKEIDKKLQQHNLLRFVNDKFYYNRNNLNDILRSVYIQKDNDNNSLIVKTNSTKTMKFRDNNEAFAVINSDYRDNAQLKVNEL